MAVFKILKEANQTRANAAVMKAMITIWRIFGTRSPIAMPSEVGADRAAPSLPSLSSCFEDQPIVPVRRRIILEIDFDLFF